MSIRFTRQNSELILILAPDGIEIQVVLDELNKGEDWHVCRCFSVSKKHLRKEDPDENELISVLVWFKRNIRILIMKYLE